MSQENQHFKKIYFVPRIDQTLGRDNMIGGVKSFISPSSARRNDWYMIFKVPTFNRLTPVLFDRPDGKDRMATSIGLMDFSEGMSLSGQSYFYGTTEICFNESITIENAPKWIPCVFGLMEDWYRPFTQGLKAFTKHALRDADVFLNPEIMGEVVKRTDPARKAIIQKVAICLMWEYWSKSESTFAQAADFMRDKKIDVNATADSVRKAVERLGLPSLRNGL